MAEGKWLTESKAMLLQCGQEPVQMTRVKEPAVVARIKVDQTSVNIVQRITKRCVLPGWRGLETDQSIEGGSGAVGN